MPDTRTLAQLRTECRNRGEIDSDFVADSELTRMINVAYRDYYGDVVDLDPGYVQTFGTLAVVNGTSEYNLPASFMRIVGLDAPDGSNWIKLAPVNFADRTRYKPPTWTGSARLWYVPTVTDLVSDSDTAQLYTPSGSEYIVTHVLIQYSGKAEEDASLFGAQLGAHKKQMAALGSRDQAEPKRVRDVYGERGMRDRFRYSTLSEKFYSRYYLAGNSIFVVSPRTDL